MLVPQNNNYRIAINLNGIWEFKTISDDYIPRFKAKKTIAMAVPGSYNDLTCDRSLKDYVGNVLYEKEISFHTIMKKDDVYLRIGAACHKQKVFIDGVFVCQHNGGFLPLDIKINSFIKENIRLSIIVDNRLDYTTLPYGEIKQGKQVIYHDFYNYSGIHRDVIIYSVPKNNIKDITITTTVLKSYSRIDYKIDCPSLVTVAIYDQNDSLVGTNEGNIGVIKIKKPKLWDIRQGNLYTLIASTKNDVYKEKFGIRKLEIIGDKIMLNDKPIYLKGFGKHEDFFIIGKANCSAVNIRDFNCMKWINANSFRTSHYPYCEEIYDLADKEGFLIINEIPAVGFNFWNDDSVFCEDKVNDLTLNTHKQQLSELINRDKNHPSVILLSVANEAATYEKNAKNYFKEIATYAKTISPWPLMIVENTDPNATNASQFFDVIGLNRYNAWYNNHGDLSVIESQLSTELKQWNQRFQKPLILSEFGADTIEGLHALPSESFSEEFQLEYLDEITKVIDQFDFIAGEHIWNFADFKTKQGLTRIRGNRKGIFTRDRQPKLAAHFIKRRWEKL